jgi:phage terminase large subunit GpA-like protein
MTSNQGDQLVARKRVRELTRRGVIYEWRERSRDFPNETLDRRVYARAALEIRGPKRIAQLEVMAEELTAAGLKAAGTKQEVNPTESQCGRLEQLATSGLGQRRRESAQ